MTSIVIGPKEKTSRKKSSLVLPKDGNDYASHNVKDVKALQSIILKHNQYYQASELQKFDPYFFHGCEKSIRNIIDEKKIPNDQYIYASYSVKTGWKKT